MKMRKHVLGLIGLAAMSFGADAGAVCYVKQDATGKNDGSSWTNAYVHPQWALLFGCTEIWVAKGVYTPSGNSNDPTAFFNIPDGTKMYGGFAGNETSIDQRKLSANPTVLSGDVGHDDLDPGSWLARTPADRRGKNSWHIIKMADDFSSSVTSATTVDGFILAAAGGPDLMDDDGNMNWGSAIFCNAKECSPVLKNLVFVGNEAFEGGAIFLNTDFDVGIMNAEITNSSFLQNWATRAAGAVEFSTYHDSLGHPHISDCTFSGNMAGLSDDILEPLGGGVFWTTRVLCLLRTARL